MSGFMTETKDFTDGYIHPDSVGLLITLCPARYDSNDVYSIQRLVLWQDLYRMPLKCRNMAMLCLLEALSDEYEFLNGKRKGKYEFQYYKTRTK